jgi:hypothetical protein
MGLIFVSILLGLYGPPQQPRKYNLKMTAI